MKERPILFTGAMVQTSRPKLELTRFKESCALWIDQHMEWFRATVVDDGIWLDVWKVRPVEEATFDPPYTLTPPTPERLT